MSAEPLSGSSSWEPPSTMDFFVLGMVMTFQTVAVLVCMHLIWCRKWPPYVTKNVNLVVISTVSGILWTAAMVLSCGFFRRRPGDVLTECDVERFYLWTTLCVHASAFFVRVYRMWRILIKHDGSMWRTEAQVAVVSSIALIPIMVSWAVPHNVSFNEITNMCHGAAAYTFVTLAMFFLCVVGAFFLWFVCVRQLKAVRRQFNEYETMTRTLLYMTLAFISYAVVVVVVLADDYITCRRVAILYPVITTFVLLLGSVYEPLKMKMLGDTDYLFSYTKGFSSLPSPAQLRANLREQLSVDQLRTAFRTYVEQQVAQELVDFYFDSLDREETSCYFERQAATMRIVERYIRAGSPDQINISEECRETVLATDVTAHDIFDTTRTEVLRLMETNFHRGFQTSDSFRHIVHKSEEEQREIRLLKTGGMLPLTPPSAPTLSPSPASLRRIWGSRQAIFAGTQRRRGVLSLARSGDRPALVSAAAQAVRRSSTLSITYPLPRRISLRAPAEGSSPCSIGCPHCCTSRRAGHNTRAITDSRWTTSSDFTGGAADARMMMDADKE